ncbi:hypothetical protein GCM10020331_094070 [Ectobacillus funiculus]
MFSFLAGITLSEYIRRRRLTLAAFELRNHKVKVIDVAVKYTYNSPDSFTRAFQNLHGITPSEARNNGSSLKAYPPMTFQLSIQGDDEMNYRIEEKKQHFVLLEFTKEFRSCLKGLIPRLLLCGKSLDENTIYELKKIIQY